MDLVFSKSLSAPAKLLAAQVNEAFIFEAEENINDLGVKDIPAMIVTMLSIVIAHAEGLESVCYDDIGAVADRIKIMITHK